MAEIREPLEGIPDDFDWSSLNTFAMNDRVHVPRLALTGIVSASHGYLVFVVPDDGTALRSLMCVEVERA